MKKEADNFHRSPRVLIVGPGSIGTTLAVRLANGGAEVTVLDHRPDRAERIRGEGLSLGTDEGLLQAAVAAVTSAAGLDALDLAILCVKCPALEQAGRRLAELPQATTVVTIQNGLGVVESLKRGLGAAAREHTLVAAVTYQAANRDAGGLVHQVANLPTLLDGSPGLRPKAEAAAALLDSAALPARVEADLRPALWRKLVVNVAINPLTALAGVRNGELARREDLREQMLTLAREVAAVARAEGLALGDAEAEQVALEAATATGENISSMRQDVEAGRATEIEFLTHPLLRLAEQHGMALPLTAEVAARIRAL
ncbi:MAG: 2-dehydropantoate 2-reductase [Anaerolineaceae bacterium]|nr:2-dehydropantoate 2-reductase [Anaerolineaceae bacterium]